jgi:hypothetical protein
MKYRFSERRAVLALLLWLVPLCATADTGSPVVVTDCRGGITSIALVEIGAYEITLRNTSPVQADDIRIAIAYDHGQIAGFDVRGKFPPNADIKKSLRKPVGHGQYTYASGRNVCDVQYVHFTNGSSWSKRRFQRAGFEPTTTIDARAS